MFLEENRQASKCREPKKHRRTICCSSFYESTFFEVSASFSLVWLWKHPEIYGCLEDSGSSLNIGRKRAKTRSSPANAWTICLLRRDTWCKFFFIKGLPLLRHFSWEPGHKGLFVEGSFGIQEDHGLTGYHQIFRLIIYCTLTRKETNKTFFQTWNPRSRFFFDTRANRLKFQSI